MTYAQNPDEMYRASEISLGAFGMGTVGERTLDHFNHHNISRHGRDGAGADLEYFFTKYIGIEAEAWSENTDHFFVDDVGGNLVFRIPIGNIGLAPLTRLRLPMVTLAPGWNSGLRATSAYSWTVVT